MLLFYEVNKLFIIIPAPTTALTTVYVTSTPFYEEVWFIVVMVVVALVFLFIFIVLCVRMASTQSRGPYVRERSPLEQIKTSQGYVDDEQYDDHIPVSVQTSL